jgi:hypothetical protein
MSHPILLELPESVYERVERTAKGLEQPIQQTLLKIVEAGLPSLAQVPVKYRSELEALESLPDSDLLMVAKSEMETTKQEKLEQLLWQQQAEGLNQPESNIIEQLHMEANRLLLRKSYATVLLKWRGYDVHDLMGL